MGQHRWLRQAGSGVTRARVTARPSGLTGRFAIAARRPPAALDTEASASPGRPKMGQAKGLPPRGARRSLSDIKITSNRVSRVSGDCHWSIAGRPDEAVK